MSLFRVHLLIILSFFLSSVFADELTGSPKDKKYKPPQITSQNILPPIDPELRKYWHESFFEIEEPWFFTGREDFEHFVEASGLQRDQKVQLRSLYKTSISYQQEGKLPLWKIPKDATGVVFVPDALRKKMPTDFLERMYRYQNLMSSRLPYFLTAHSKEDFIKFSSPALSKEQKIEFQKNILFLDNQLTFPVTPYTWTLLNPATKDSAIDYFHRFETVISPSVVIRPEDDIEAVGRYFAGGRDPEPLIRYLKYLRSLNGTKTFSVPLEKILHPFIRKTTNTHSQCDGPNCYNATKNVTLGNRFSFEFLSSQELAENVIQGYRQAGKDELTRPGDLLIYSNSKYKIRHAAVVAADEIVFTKNGRFKLNVYGFQERKSMEAVYFPDGKFQVNVYKAIDPEILKQIERSRPITRVPCDFKALGAQKAISFRSSE